jgi:hypothetical protein
VSQQVSVELSHSIKQFREYMKSDEGKNHIAYLKEKEPKETREVLEKLRSLSNRSPEFVEFVLYGLLPNSDTKYAKRVSLSPSFLNIRKFFGRFNYSEKDWQDLANLVFTLISKFESNPAHLDDCIREFISNRLSKALQCGSITPILFALNQKFPIVNNREIRVFRELSFQVLEQPDELSRRLENYIADISKIERLVGKLATGYGFVEVKDLAVFDLFCYWYDETKGGEEPKLRKTKSVTSSGVSPLDDSQVASFIQALACSQPQPYFIGMGDGPFNLLQLNTEGRIIYNTEFQRGEVWDKPRKQKLIDSILRGYNINTIFFRQLPDGKFECLDGQQRLKTIQEFLNDKFPINPKFTPEFKHEAKFNELPETLKNKIRSYAIYVITFYTNKDDETCKIFLRLQEGLPLNAPEKLNAMMGSLRDLVVDLARHPFMKNIGIDDYRFAHRYIIAQAFLLTLRNQITDVKFRYLEEMYATYKTANPPESVVSAITKTLNLLEREFGIDAQTIHYNADFLTLFSLTKHLAEAYVVSNPALDLKGFFIDFATRVGQVQTSEGGNVQFFDYKAYRKTSADSRNSMEKRFEIMLARFLQYNQSLTPKDPKRNYDYWEKLAVYNRDKGICKICGGTAPFDKGTVDHRMPHSKGGPTTIENGQWAHIQCNLEKLAKIP